MSAGNGKGQRIVGALLAILFALDTSGAVEPIVVNERLPSNTLQVVYASWDAKFGEPTSVVYGNAKFGYFRSRRFTYEQGKLTFDFIAPGFGVPLDTFACRERAKGQRCHFLKSLVPKVSALYEPGFSYYNTTKGLPTWRFLLLSGRLPFAQGEDGRLLAGRCHEAATKFEKPTAGFVYIINRSGQIVWSHVFPPDAEASPLGLVVAKPLAHGRVGVLMGTDKMHFDVIDHYGKAVWSEDLGALLGPMSIHHDFVTDGDDKLGVLTSQIEAYEKPWRWWSFWQLSMGQKFNLLKQGIAWIDLETGKLISTRAISYFENPFDEVDWWSNIGTYVRRLVDEGTDPAVDPTHANSLQRLATGFLVSLNIQSRITFLADAGPAESWSIGPNVHNLYNTLGSSARFYAQHHVTSLPDGKILLFDNLGDRKGGSRLLRFSLDREHHRPVLDRAFYPDPPVYTERHGSAETLANGHLVGFFAAKSKGPCDLPSEVVEFDGDTGTEVSRTSIEDLGVLAVGYRAVPMDAVGPSEYLGMTFTP